LHHQSAVHLPQTHRGAAPGREKWIAPPSHRHTPDDRLSLHSLTCFDKNLIVLFLYIYRWCWWMGLASFPEDNQTNKPTPMLGAFLPTKYYQKRSRIRDGIPIPNRQAEIRLAPARWPRAAGRGLLSCLFMETETGETRELERRGWRASQNLTSQTQHVDRQSHHITDRASPANRAEEERGIITQRGRSKFNPVSISKTSRLPPPSPCAP
jgi:hypothetical protein